MLGPGPPPKKERKPGNRRDLNSAGQNSSNGSSTVVGAPSEEALEGTEGRTSGEGWNRKRYQRDDELLWGLDESEDDPGRMPGLSRTITTRSGSNYYVARNPAVNDLHPPVVSSHPTHRRETKWMLQPPPSAKIMEGKEKANRSRSGSGGSNGSSKRNVDSTSLGRQIGERSVEEKVKRGERPPTADSAALTKKKSKDWGAMNGSIEGAGQRHDREAHPSTHSRTSSTSSIRRTRTIPTSEDQPRAHLFSTCPPDLHLDFPQRPPLAVIASSSLFPLSSGHTPQPQFTAFHSTTTTTTVLTRPLTSNYPPSSPPALQEVHLPSSTPNAPREPKPHVPSPAKAEDPHLLLPECESWFPGRDFRFPPVSGREPERERVSVPMQRWSMEI